jgi:hypothetical protein
MMKIPYRLRLPPRLLFPLPPLLREPPLFPPRGALKPPPPPFPPVRSRTTGGEIGSAWVRAGALYRGCSLPPLNDDRGVVV